MNRSLRTRIGSALLAAVYLALPGGAWGVRTCAHHDGPLAAHSPHADRAADVHQHGPDHTAAPGEAAVADVGPALSLDGRSAAGQHGCSCLEACAVTGHQAVAPTATATSLRLPKDEHTVAPRPAGAVPHVDRPPHFLPFTHAPPADPS